MKNTNKKSVDTIKTMKQNSSKYYKVYTAADGRVCIASVEFSADFGANAPDNCPCMGYIKVMHGNKRAEAPCYLMPAKMAKLLKPEEYRPAPTGGNSPAEPKSRPDAATMALYWLLTDAAAFADAEPQRVFENGKYKLIAKEAPDMLKRLKREFNITKSDLNNYPPTVAPALVQDQQQSEPTPAPVEDIEAAVVAHFEDLAANAPDDEPAAEAETVTEAAPAEARKFRLYYVNNSDKAVSRVVELIKADVEGSPLPVWIECREDDYGRKYGRTCYQLTDSICFRANAGYISEEYISPLTGGELSDWHKEHIDMFNNGIANIKAEIIATPAAQLNGTMWPNLAVVNAYTAAGMATEAAYLIAARERITKEREERRKTQEEEARRREEERRRQEAEEKARRIAEAIKKFMEKGEITGEDVVLLCDEEGIKINPRTRHNLLEVVTYFENNGNRAHYKTYGKRKPSLDGCFTVADRLYQLLKIKANEAENAAPAAPDFAEVLAADAAAMPLALPAITEGAIIEQAARIKAAHEAMKAEAEREQTAAAFADAITAYCEELSRPAPLAWEPETIIIPFEPRPAAEVEQPRQRHPLSLRPRLSRWLDRVSDRAIVRFSRVALLFGICWLALGLLIGAGNRCAEITPAEFAAVVELPAVTITAEATATADEVEAPTPSQDKNIAAVTPSEQKTADNMNAAADGDDRPMLTDTPTQMQPAPSEGLTICAGTAWAYTMMNWA